MKLKTLQDLGFFTAVREIPSFKKVKEKAHFEWEIKAEAIKWVKNWKEYDKEMYASAIDGFMEFFNITEEDLLEEKRKEYFLDELNAEENLK